MKKIIYTLLSVTIIFSSCKKDEEPEFDRQGLLDNMATNVIIPYYQALNSSFILLHTEATEFVANPDLSTLTNLRGQYSATNTAYQYCSMYNFGPAMDYGIKAALNTFPTDTSIIETNISSGTYTLGSLSNTTAIGFPALDYLLYFGNDEEIISKFTTDSEAANRKNYLTDLTAKMKSEFQPVLNKWNGTYKATFIAADGNDVGSSCSFLLNEFVKDLELLKNARIGIPSGQQTGGATLPEYVEGYYSGKSMTFANDQLQGLRIAFTGGSGIGFDDYIIDVEGEEVTTSLATNINQQIDVCFSKMALITNPLSSAVNTNYAAVNTLYLEIKKLLVYCKTDMTSMLGILITYQDNDGD